MRKDIKGLPRGKKQRAACLHFLRLLSEKRLVGTKFVPEGTAFTLMAAPMKRARLVSGEMRSYRPEVEKLLGNLVKTGVLTRGKRGGYGRCIEKRDAEERLRQYEMRVSSVVSGSGAEAGPVHAPRRTSQRLPPGRNATGSRHAGRDAGAGDGTGDDRRGPGYRDRRGREGDGTGRRARNSER